MNFNSNTNHEQHPLFPSGEWEGFYKYKVFKEIQCKMEFSLNFCDGVVTGAGSDNVGAFEWQGMYNKQQGTCKMTKFYVGEHAVFYDGNADENGIWGTWIISTRCTGVFHIWPKKKNGADEDSAEETIAEAYVAHGELTLVNT